MASISNPLTLVLARCPETSGSDAAFELGHNNTAPKHAAAKQHIVHKASGKCVQGEDTGPVLATCDAKQAAQEWVFGKSGRFCMAGKGCITAGGAKYL
jgi:hypothetical protein